MDDQILSVIGGFLSLPITGFAKNFVVGLLLENYSCYRSYGIKVEAEYPSWSYLE